MTSPSRKVFVVMAVCLAVAIYTFQVTRGTGPISTADAEELLVRTLPFERERIETIAPDGEIAKAPPSVLQKVRALDCPKLSSTWGSTPGRYGSGARTYGGARFRCLFTGETPSGTLLYFSAHVTQTSDPAETDLNNGRRLYFEEALETRTMMREMAKETRPHSKAQQAALWAELANDDIYVPADKTRKSPLQKTMDKHFNKLMSQ
ncbi:hypothetical protein [Roseibium sp. M-1]